MSGFEFEYTLWVFLSTIGIFQYTALKNNLWGFVVLRNMPSITKILSILIITSSFLWFFLSEDRNVPDTTEGIDGVVQTRWFAIGAISAIAMLTFIASITNHRWGAQHGWDSSEQNWPPIGISWIERTTFFWAIFCIIQAIYKNGIPWKTR